MIRRKYFKKLFVIYFTFTLVYGIILTSFFVFQNNQNLRKQQINHHISAAEQVAKNLDQRIWSFQKYAETLYLDSDVNAYLTSNKDYYAITNVHNKLRADMAVFTDMGALIAITKFKDDLIISNQFTRTIDMFYEEMGFDESMAEAIAVFYEEGNRNEALLLHDSGYNQLHIIRKSFYGYNDFFLMIQTVDTSMLQIGMNATEYEFYLSDRVDEVGKRAVSVTENNKDYIILDDAIFVLKQSGIHEDLFYLLERDYGVLADAFEAYFTAAILFGVLTVIGMLVALFATRKIYKPIGTVLSKFEEDEANTTDEFAFLEKMTFDIMAANDAMQSVINSNRLDLKTKYIRDMLHGLLPDVDQTNLLNEYKMSYLSGFCRVVLIQIQEQDALVTEYSSEARSQIKSNVHTILQKTLTLEGLFFELVELDYSSYGLIVGEWQEEGLRLLLSKLLKAIKAGEQVDIVMAVGPEVEGYLELPKSFTQTTAILDYKQTYDKRAIVTLDDVVDTNIKERFHYPLDLEKDLFGATLNGNVEKIGVLFEQIIQINLYDRTLETRERSGLLISLLTTLRRVEQKMSQNIEVDDNEVLSAMNTMEHEQFEAFLREVQGLFVAYANTAREKTASKDDEVSELMVNYIEEHYHEDVSLEDAAAFLNISAGYFCTIFKKLTGTNFKNYLNQFRVQKAKEILKHNPNEKIKELTLQLGYNNVNSFIRMFKKYEGISPGEYARRLQNKDV